MKELIRFRQFLAEGQINENLSPLAQALIKVYEEEIEAEKAETGNDDTGLAIQAVFRKGIEMLKNGVDPESVNDKVQGLYINATGDFSYDPVIMIDAAKEMIKENIFDPKFEVPEPELPSVPGVKPEVVRFFYKLQPEEVPGSWDDINHRFTVPHSYENLDYTEEDFQDSTHWLNAQDKGVELGDLPTEYIEIATYPVGDESFPVTARNFAKYVPGKGLMYKFTTEEG